MSVPQFSLMAGLPGDVNNDGQLNNIDILMAQFHCIGMSDLDFEARMRGDINSNGDLDIGDIILMGRLSESGGIVMPDLIGETRFQAESILTEMGLTLGQTILIRTDGHANFVRGQHPAKGQLVLSDTPVDLFVTTRDGSGATLLQVSPDVIDLGETGTQAIFSLRAADPSIPWYVHDSGHTTTTPKSGQGDAQLTVRLNRIGLPQTESGMINVPVYPELGSTSGSAIATIRYRRSTPSEPRLDSVNSRQPLCPGDTVVISGGFFAQATSDNQVAINGTVLEATAVNSAPAQITFRIPPDTVPGVVEIRARRVADPKLGPSDWGNPITVRLSAAANLVLNHGEDGEALWFNPATSSVREVLGISRIADEEAFAPDWVLGGRNLLSAGGVTINPVFDPSRWGVFDSRELALEVVLNGKSYYIPAIAKGDDVLIVRPYAMLYDGAELLSLLEPGITFPARLIASDQKTLQLRTSNWIELRVSPDPAPIGSIIGINTKELLTRSGWPDDAEHEVSIGSTLMIWQAYDDPSFSLYADGLRERSISLIRITRPGSREFDTNLCGSTRRELTP
jgi:hypothetical protein